jgi:hypothetical protein
VGDAGRVVERLLAGIVVGLAIGLVAAWIGLRIAGLALAPHPAGPSGLPRRPPPVAPFPGGHGRSFAAPVPVAREPASLPRG